jgi:hypothetical protein
MPAQLFLCSPLLENLSDFTTVNRPHVTGKLLLPASHKPPSTTSFDVATSHEVAEEVIVQYSLVWARRTARAWQANYAGGFKDEAARRRPFGKVQF